MRLLSQAVLAQRGAELKRRADAIQAGDSPADRIAALAELARRRTATFARSGPWLALEVDAAEQQLLEVQGAGLPWDEPLAAALLHAAAALGAGWPADLRLCEGGHAPEASLLALWRAVRPAADIAARLDAAMARAEALQAPCADALARWLAEPQAPRARQRLRRAAFGDDDSRSAAFEAAETAALAAAGLHDTTLRTWCIAGDTAYGQGRCVRIAKRAAGAGRHPMDDVSEACHGLVQDTDR